MSPPPPSGCCCRRTAGCWLERKFDDEIVAPHHRQFVLCILLQVDYTELGKPGNLPVDVLDVFVDDPSGFVDTLGFILANCFEGIGLSTSEISCRDFYTWEGADVYGPVARLSEDW